MSASLRFYSIDIQKVASLIGCRAHNLIAEVQRAQGEFWATEGDVDENEGELTSTAALQKILRGDLRDEHADDLNAALELLCRHFGEHIPMPSFEDIHYNFLGEIAVADELLSTRLPFAFPYDSEGFPRTCSLSRDRIRELVVTLLEKIPQNFDGHINAVRVEFLEMLEFIADEGNDLIAFYG